MDLNKRAKDGEVFDSDALVSVPMNVPDDDPGAGELPPLDSYDETAVPSPETTKAPKAASPVGRPLAGELLHDAVAMMRRRATGDDQPSPVGLWALGKPVLWPDAERALGGGWWPGLWMLVGPTGVGKTQLALSLALTVAEAGSPVAYVGLELDDLGIVSRLAGLLSGSAWSDLYLGNRCKRGDPSLPAMDGPGVSAALERLAGLPLSLAVAEPMGWPYGRITTLAAELAAQRDELAAEADRRGEVERARSIRGRPPLMVLDFLQIVGGEATDGDLPLRERIQRASYHAREAARKHGVAVLAVSSTSRENAKSMFQDPAEGLPHPDTLVGTGKESGEIEYSADGVLVLVGYQTPDVMATGDRPVALALAKLRAGKTRWLHLMFNGHRHRPASADEVAEVQAAQAPPETLTLAGNVADVAARIERVTGLDELERLTAAEQRKGKRDSVFKAIAKRRDELNGSTKRGTGGDGDAPVSAAVKGLFRQ